jgi:hypothetical protein
MKRPALFDDLNPGRFIATSVIQLFPFMPRPSWYQDYWYPERSGRVGKWVENLLRLSRAARDLSRRDEVCSKRGADSFAAATGRPNRPGFMRM